MQDMWQTTTSTAPDFFELARQNGVPVVEMRLPKSKSLSVPSGDTGVIGLDCSTRVPMREAQARVGHELGHCLYGGFYTRSTPYDVVGQHEWRADKWYILHAIPRDTLFVLLDQDLPLWEIAEKLNTTEQYIRKAYQYYIENP